MAGKKKMIAGNNHGSVPRALLALAVASATVLGAESHQATGVRVGEVTPTSAIVWMRLTANSTRSGRPAAPRTGEKQKLRRVPEGTDVSTLEGAVPGMAGEVRLRYATSERLSGARATPWVKVSAQRDYTHKFTLTGLKPGAQYFYSAETRASGQTHAPLRGSFRTAPEKTASKPVTFAVTTGLMYQDLDHPDGFEMFAALLKQKPDFFVFTGDNVYYDNDDLLANSVALARHHWHRMFSLPRSVAFLLEVPAYWEKDDHDVLQDDVWPTLDSPLMKPLTFRQGQEIFQEQTPVGETPYRTFRWGRHLQVWLTEGRDYRSANNAPDGPDKSIWGREQRAWLQQSLLSSDAEWKVLVSPTPLVGPDRTNKRDNHANAAFATEGRGFRAWAMENLLHNFFVVCGDRHWQYHSVEPESGLQEFSTGPASDLHAGGTPGYDAKYHRFHRVAGGYATVSVEPTGAGSHLFIRLHDVQGKAVYESVFRP